MSPSKKPTKTEAQRAFGLWLKAHRDTLDITAAEAAKKAGVDPTTWRSLEAPGMPWHAPSSKTIRGIAEVFGVPVEEVAARAGVALPTLDGFTVHASPAAPSEMLELVLRLTEQLADAQRLHAEALERLTELTAGESAPKRQRRPRPSR